MAEPLSLYAVFGQPIHHSLSPVMHNRAFASESMPCFYLPVEVSPLVLDERLEDFRRLGGRGVNLTRPLKETVLPHLGAYTDWVRLSGAANTLVWQENHWLGDNTDCQALFGLLPVGEGRSALVLGAGGVARATAAVLKVRGYHVIAAARSPGRADFSDEVMAWSRRMELSGTVHVVVNATPLGQTGEADEDEWPMPAEGGVCVDWVYRPRETRFLRQAEQHRVGRVDGLALLVEQAALAWKAWFGREGPRAVMEQAVRSWR